MIFDIRPNVGVGSITFGASIRDTRRALAAPLATIHAGWAANVSTFFKDSRRNNLPVDDFAALGLHVHNRIEGALVVCNGVELFRPAKPTCEGVSLLVEPFGEVRS